MSRKLPHCCRSCCLKVWLYDRIVSLCSQAGFEPRVVHEEVKNQTRVGLVAAGIGITFVPESLQNSTLSGVVYRPLAGTAPELQLAAAWRCDGSRGGKSDRVSPVLQGFLHIVRQVSAPSPELKFGLKA